MAWIQSEAKREAQKFAEKHRVKSAEKSPQEAETASLGAEVTLFKEDSELTVGLSNQTMALIKDMAKKDLEKGDEEVKPVSNVVSETEEDLTEEDQKRETEAEESFASIESEGEKSDDQSVGLGEQTLAEIRFCHCFDFP